MQGSTHGLPAGSVTQYLKQMREGDAEALDLILPLVYDELHRLAHRRMDREGGDSTLRTTVLVHEAYLKLTAGHGSTPSDRAHFLAIAGRAMRQVLVDYARRRRAERHGGGWERTTLTDASGAIELDLDEILALDAALDELEPRQRCVVEGRFFGGMSESELAGALGISVRTVHRDWVKARAWLYRALYRGPPSP